MGWWSTGNGDDVVGDTTADLVGDELQALAARREKAGKPRPTLDELLRALGLALSRQIEAGGEYEDTGPIRGVAARVERDGEQAERRVDLAARHAVDDDLLDSVQATIADLEDQYEQMLDRRPRISELLACFAFVLGSQPEDYLKQEPGSSVKSIAADGKK